MSLTSKPNYWTDAAWLLYRYGLLRVVVALLLPVYVLVGVWDGGVREALRSWRIELHEASL